jgi:hypothetical protein
MYCDARTTAAVLGQDPTVTEAQRRAQLTAQAQAAIDALNLEHPAIPASIKRNIIATAYKTPQDGRSQSIIALYEPNGIPKDPDTPITSDVDRVAYRRAFLEAGGVTLPDIDWQDAIDRLRQQRGALVPSGEGGAAGGIGAGGLAIAAVAGAVAFMAMRG